MNEHPDAFLNINGGAKPDFSKKLDSAGSNTVSEAAESKVEYQVPKSIYQQQPDKLLEHGHANPIANHFIDNTQITDEVIS